MYNFWLHFGLHFGVIFGAKCAAMLFFGGPGRQQDSKIGTLFARRFFVCPKGAPEGAAVCRKGGVRNGDGQTPMGRTTGGEEGHRGSHTPDDPKGSADDGKRAYALDVA